MAVVKRLQVSLGCNKQCESCSKYFDCSSELKKLIFKSPQMLRVARNMQGVKYKIAVLSGKGGVGKSTTTANLAASFALMGARVGVLDSDFYGPSQATLFGIGREKLQLDEGGIVPVAAKYGVQVATVASTLGETEAITWAVGP